MKKSCMEDKEFRLTEEQKYFIEHTVPFEIFEQYDAKYRSLYPDGWLTTMVSRKTYFQSDIHILTNMREEVRLKMINTKLESI